VRTTVLPPVDICRVRTVPLFPPVVIVVVAVDFAARTFVFERAWSFPWAAIATDPLNIAPATTLISMCLVFIILFWF
ncbi:MAG: hypothetical protein QOE81_1905, partial [Verrucomicrobiota bacterium]